MHFSWQQNLMFSLLLNLFITGIFAFVGFVFPTNKLLPASYYQVKNPGTLKWIYKTFGVEYFRHFLLHLFWGRAKNSKRYFSGTQKGLTAFDYQTRQSEFGHFAAFIIITIAAPIISSSGNLLFFVATTLLNVIGNLYPIILQRMHRLQITRLITLQKARKNT